MSSGKLRALLASAVPSLLLVCAQPCRLALPAVSRTGQGGPIAPAAGTKSDKYDRHGLCSAAERLKGCHPS